MSQTLSVLNISTTDNWGGAARAAYRAHTGLKRLGVQSRFYVGMKVTSDPDVCLIAGRGLRVLDRACRAVTDQLGLQYLVCPSSWVLPSRRWLQDADVVQLHNTHGDYFSHTVLPVISRTKPVVWCLHDMWSMTGHCAYSYDCERWKTGCGSCPLLSDTPALRHDTTALLWRIKRMLYGRSNLTIVAPSTWMVRVASESPLLRSRRIEHIPYGIDTDLFRPIDSRAAREALGLPTDGRVVLFTAHFIFDPRKGAAIVREVVGRLRAKGQTDLTLLVVGAGASAWMCDEFRVRAIETVNNDELMAIIYSASDVFLFPTLSENLANGILESLACGTPVVAFDVGGCTDAVRHLETGYLAKYRDVDDLTRGVETLLADADLRLSLGGQARQIAEQEYTLALQARRLEALYRDVAGVAA